MTGAMRVRLDRLYLLLLCLAATCEAAPRDSDAQIIREATGGRLTATTGTVFEPACNERLPYEAEVVDLNKDGQPEVFTLIHGTCLGGGAGASVNLAIKGPDGIWRWQFGFPGVYRVLETGAGGYPDIEIGGPGECFPIWRWNGTAYALHKGCP